MEQKEMNPIERELEEIKQSLREDDSVAFIRRREESKGESYVRLSEDGMEAWLYLAEPGEGEAPYTKEGLIAFLAQNNVVYGLNKSNLSAMAKKKVYEREIKVAEGFPAIPGKDGYYDYFFTPENLLRKPTIREDGSVDYASMSALQNVKKGDPVAEYHDSVPGEDGYKVTGEIVKADSGKDLRPLTGRGIIKEEDSNIYLAATDGKIEAKDGRIDIQTLHEINGDVDLVIGKIEFYGDVVINGNIGAGVVVRAGRNLTVTGTVEGCTLDAGGDIVLQRGIQGAEKAMVVAQGSVYAEFIEYSSIKAGCNVQSNTILNSTVFAGGEVKVSGKKGAIVGGYTHGLCGVEAQKLGNEAEVKTVVHSGFLPENYERFLELKKQETPMKEKLGEIVDDMTELMKAIKKNNGQMSGVQERRLDSLNHQKDELRDKLVKISTEKEKYKAEMDKGSGATITIKGPICRGSVICMEDARMPMLKQDSFMKYTVNCGAIDGQVVAI